jgi:DNA replication protein DnaC
MNHEELTKGLRSLFCHQMAREYVEVSKLAEKDKRTYEQYLANLVGLELEGKKRLKVNRLIHQAKLPLPKTMNEFDFDAISGLSRQEFLRLTEGHFVREASNVVFYGTFGAGKTHLAMALTRKLCELGYKCLFITTHELINQLIEAKRNLTLTALFKRLDKIDLITCDELGYVPHDQDGADLFFQLIAQRAERKSLLITTNLTYSEWQSVFINPLTTAAAVDRVIHQCETFVIKAPSWRGKTAKKKMETKTNLQNVSE